MNKISTLLQKLWSGNLSAQEAAELNELLGQNDAGIKQGLLDSFKESLAQPQTADADTSTSELYTKLLLKIKETEDKRAKVISMARSSIGWAAAVIILAFTGGLMYQQFQDRDQKKSVVVSNKYSSSLKSITNNSKDKMIVHLADGSIVTLFSNSTVSYREGFDEKVRNIQLDNGMAYFKVAKNAEKPFIVLSGGLTTTALGTEFSVDTRQRGNVEVKLFEGKVAVKSARKGLLKKDIFLTPMHSFTANFSTGRFEVKKFNADAHLPTTRKKKDLPRELPDAELNFVNEQLEQVFNKLNQKYSANIKYTKPQLKGFYFTGTIFRNDSLKTILTVISKMNGLTLEEKDGCIQIGQKK